VWQEAHKLGVGWLAEKFNKTIHERKFLNQLEEAFAHKDNNRLQNFTGAMLNFHTMQSTQYMSRWIEAKNTKS